MLDAPVPGKKRRGRQKTRWKDSCKRDMESAGLKEEDVPGTGQSGRIIFNTIPATPDDGKARGEDVEDEQDGAVLPRKRRHLRPGV